MRQANMIRSSVPEETSVSCQADMSNSGFSGDITLGVSVKVTFKTTSWMSNDGQKRVSTIATGCSSLYFPCREDEEKLAEGQKEQPEVKGKPHEGGVLEGV